MFLGIPFFFFKPSELRILDPVGEVTLPVGEIGCAQRVTWVTLALLFTGIGAFEGAVCGDYSLIREFSSMIGSKESDSGLLSMSP